MNAKKSHRNKRRKYRRYLWNYGRKHFTVIAPVVVVLLLILGAYIGGSRGGFVIHRNTDRGTLLQSDDRKAGAVSKDTQPLYIGLRGICDSLVYMQEYGIAASVKDTENDNAEILIGAAKTGRAAYRQKCISESMAKTEITYLDGVTIIRENQMAPEEYYTLLQIVEAEATGEDFEGKRLIANVILNRVKDERFPNTIEEVVWQQVDGSAQFQPTVDGRFYEVKVSQDTINAVDEALQGVDESHGALFFMARNGSDEHNVTWFDSSLKKLFTHGGHEYYTLKTDAQLSWNPDASCIRVFAYLL